MAASIVAAVPTIRVAAPPDPAADAIVTAGLRSALRPIWGAPNGVALSVYLEDDGRVVGGLVGHIAWQWLLVERLWVDEAYRGRGHGERLLAAAERQAAEVHACVGAHLDTFGDAALPFYRRCGYEIWGTLEDFPPGGRRHFLRKRLVAGSR